MRDEAYASGVAQQVRVFESAQYLADHLQDIPVHVIPCILIDQIPEDPPRRVWASLMGSILPAVWSFELAFFRDQARKYIGHRAWVIGESLELVLREAHRRPAVARDLRSPAGCIQRDFRLAREEHLVGPR